MHLTGQEILSGAWFQLDRGVEFLVRNLGWDFLQAWEQCSRIPARAVGLELPELQVGGEATFTVARWEDGVAIEHSLHLGKDYAANNNPRSNLPESK